MIRADDLFRTRMYGFLVATVFVAGLLLLTAEPAHAATFTVTNTNDSEAGSLRQAITDANNATGADTINFNIPGSEVKTISPTSSLPTITDPVTINGYSQPGAKANTKAVGSDAVLKIELNGTNAGTANGLSISASNSTVIKGLVINRFPADGIHIHCGTNIKVEGNFIGTAPSGTVDQGNGGGGVVVESDFCGVAPLSATNVVGGTSPSARNLISGNDNDGVHLIDMDTGKVQGNYVGTDKSGTQDLGNRFKGIRTDNSVSITIGGTVAGARNVVLGNDEDGIAMRNAERNQVQGNYVGTNATGTQGPGNGFNGVLIDSGHESTIGGTKAGARNVISSNGRAGVLVFQGFNASLANRILSNSTYDNGGLGIDLSLTLVPDGVTANDDDDGDVGPNSLQNYPVLSSAKTTTRATTIEGTLNSTANTTFTLQFFGSLEADPSGFGEGQKFRFQKSVTTDSSGNASFTFTTKKKVPKGQFVTATATNNATGDTSEFSNTLGVR